AQKTAMPGSQLTRAVNCLQNLGVAIFPTNPKARPASEAFSSAEPTPYVNLQSIPDDARGGSVQDTRKIPAAYRKTLAKRHSEKRINQDSGGETFERVQGSKRRQPKGRPTPRLPKQCRGAKALRPWRSERGRQKTIPPTGLGL